MFKPRILVYLIQSSQELITQQNLQTYNLIAEDIYANGMAVIPNALPIELIEGLWSQVHGMSSEQFDQAGIGRENELMQNHFVRRDEICWINGSSPAGQAWLDWTHQLQQFLNKRLFLGLFSFESHFAHYGPGDFYKRHVDAFKGDTNRILSVVLYLNPGWVTDDAGELVIYQDEFDLVGTKILPHYGTLVTFLSDEFPHEVLAANRDRYSIAGWFRVNTSTADKADPPR
ncbi:2OG-Fe(II) oxygenase [Aliiglaciecola sp. LCG003]|uniref:2OG-Fe(II) oxygenase n=1 Tax=Aliiglaciecola sp. LCG003 TaxID=3053655 RepID=UPI0025748CA2|nr:2OG-Fe(II) oxygenase [Aliiglaciecola sp. LCG003]WJG11021.1 2OG-Fe(II) oxygenase [Aliiglaciecola sp. LCG003]